nr:hypothetical protein [Tanacetum cinerariifolium]
TYCDYASGAKETKKAWKFKKPASPKLKIVLVLPKEPTKKPAKAKKNVPLTKKSATKPKPTKKKALVKADRGKVLNVLSEVALSEAAQLKEATKQSKKYFHISQASDSGDGTNFELGVLDEQRCKISCIDEGTDDSEDVSDDDKGNDDDNNDKDDNNDYDEADKEEEEHESKRVYAPPEFVPTDKEDKSDDEEKIDEEEDDDVTKELYKYVNVNLGNKDADMTNADQGGADQQNASQESGFKYVEKDAHVTLTAVHDT